MKVKDGRRYIMQTTDEKKKVIVALPVSDKDDFQTRSILKNKYISSYKSQSNWKM